MSDDESELVRDAMRQAALDPAGIAARMAYARFTADTFQDVGTKLHVLGHILGNDRSNGLSPFGHGDDATVAVSMLLRIGGQLVGGCADLVDGGRHYAGAALVRQLVEVEYLAWAFENDNEESRRWLRSTREERHSFFTPTKLRKAAAGHFRSADYGFHCELGGHPVPGSWRLLTDAAAVGQLMLSDCVGHSTRIWGHVFDWAAGNLHGKFVSEKHEAMGEQFAEWKRLDAVTALPPPPI